MLKHVILFIIFSIAAMILQLQLEHVLQFLLFLHDKIADGLGMVFSSARSGRMIQETVALLILPLIAGGVAALVFWLIKRYELPNIITVVWFVWTVLLVTVLAQPTEHMVTKTAKSNNAGNNAHAAHAADTR